MKKLPEASTPKDLELWKQEIQDVNPINQPQEAPTSSLVISEITPSVNCQGLYNSNSFNYLKVGDTSNIDKNTADKFLKGNYKIDARIDLHGLTENEAFEAVKNFITNSFIKKYRCVLIITGKGIKDEDKPWYETKGVIREALPSWLNHYDIRPFILSFAPAKISDGGTGAMYVLLKRQRSN